MRKNTTDELFAAKLAHHGVAPTQRAADLFQKRLAQKQRPKGIFMTMPARNYYWAAAASILFALGIGWYSSQNTPGTEQFTAQQTKTQVDAKDDSKLIRNKQDVQLPSEKPEVIAVIPEKVIEKPAKTFRSNKINRSTLTPQVAVKVKENKPFTIPTVKPMILDEPIMDQLTVAVLDAQKERQKEATKNRKAQNEANGVFKNSIAETVVVITEIRPAEEKLMIPEINGDSPVTVARATQLGRERMDSERSFIAKVFTEIKHLKHGERMDVAGLNQKSEEIFARADEGFIANEKQELSYRLGRIKGLFSKESSR